MSSLVLGRPASPRATWARRRKAARRALKPMLVACCLLWVGASANAAWAGSYLARCPAPSGARGDRLTVTTAEPDLPGGGSRALPIEAQSVLAVLPAPRRAAGVPEPQTLTITGALGKSGFETREVTAAPVSLATPAPYFVP